MRVRWILVALAIGIYFAWRSDNLMAAYFTSFGCMILYALRKIEGRLIKTPAPEPTEKVDYDSPQWQIARARAQEAPFDDPDGLWPRLNAQERERVMRISP